MTVKNGWWLIIIWFVCGLLLAAAIRFGMLENADQDLLCRQSGDSAICALRASLGLWIHYQVFGLAGLILGLAGWVPGFRKAAYGGLLLAGCGLMLFNATYAAVAAVVALLSALQAIPPKRK